MRTQKYSLLLLSFFAFLFFGCEEGLLEPQYDGALTDENIWSHPVYAEGVLIQAYDVIPESFMHYNNNFLDAATDNAATNQYSSAMYALGQGGWAPEKNPVGQWTTWYEQIRNANLWLENGQDTPYSLSDAEFNEQIRERLYGEAHFLRAWNHWQLLQAFGGLIDGQPMGVPIVMSVHQQDEQLTPRSTYEACVTAIISDCDTAAKYLPEKYDQTDGVYAKNLLGRANSLAALALKSRVALYAASPAFNTTNDVVLWERAAQFSKEAIDAIGNSLPSVDESIASDINHPELIMARQGEDSNTIESVNKIPSQRGQGRTAPSQNLVDAFPDKFGFPINHVSTSYDPANPYKTRDPRFYQAILYNGSKSNGSKVESFVGGKDTEITRVEASRTSYYLKKWLILSVNLDAGDVTKGKHLYALFRKGELYLNYAEAALNAWGAQQDPNAYGITALDAIHTLRKRARIDNQDYLLEVATEGDAQFLELIHNERRLELCFEGHRFWDLRRWNVGLLKLNEALKGARIERIEEGEEVTYSYTYYDVEQRNYQDYMNYGPIPASEVNKGIRQNDGW
ncbi:MAG: RagB/SusD family nutrient uptake outer membrane protein [Bacteroidales bacterium]|nr:RagB/SusD family nutrient uptake outer membrane protein [Bacteroidales bacterium]